MPLRRRRSTIKRIKIELHVFYNIICERKGRSSGDLEWRKMRGEQSANNTVPVKDLQLQEEG